MQATILSVPGGNRKADFDEIGQLCDCAQEGNLLAEKLVLGIITPPLKRMLERIVWDKNAVEDLLQDTLVMVLVKLRAGAVRQPEQVCAFACGVGRNLLIKHLRKGQLFSGRISIDSVAERAMASGDCWDPVDRLIQAESSSAILAQIDKLPRARDRRVLIGHYFQDCSARRLSRELGLKEAHFYRVLYRARKRLQKLLAPRRH